MSKTFKCIHCGQRFKKNQKIKFQGYCGSKPCQQSRKNKWEREKLQTDPDYKSKRKASKNRWYKSHPGDKYQSDYRAHHPDYVSTNVKQQRRRNKKRNKPAATRKIVKTDTLNPESFTSKGLYALIPYNKTDFEKIVKTDALIVQMVYGREIEGLLVSNSS